MSSAFIAGVGASTPIGFDARQTTLVLRARKVVPRRTTFAGRLGPVGTVRARRLDDDLVGMPRWSALAGPALREVLQGAPPRVAAAFVAMPPSRPGDRQTGEGWLVDLARAGGITVDRAPEVVRVGQAGFAAALCRAVDFLSRSPGMDVLVGGVDSHHDPELLAELDREYRLHGHGAADGFIPSEGAGFLRLSSRDDASFAQLVGVSAGAEVPETPDQPWTGEVATSLFRNAIQHHSSAPVWLVTDVNGERRRVKEWDVVRIRNRDVIADDSVTYEPYDELGDVGAASGAIYGAVVAWSFRLGIAPLPAAVVALASDGTERGVFALRSSDRSSDRGAHGDPVSEASR